MRSREVEGVGTAPTVTDPKVERFEADSLPAGHGAQVLDKDFATARARLAFAGWTLAPDGNGFIARRRGRTTDLADLAAVKRFALMVGAPQ